jgi:hypothetical protein
MQVICPNRRMYGCDRYCVHCKKHEKLPECDLIAAICNAPPCVPVKPKRTKRGKRR